MSEANCQTQSKDLVFAGATGGDARRSRTKACTISILMMSFLLLSVVSFSPTARRFPGNKSELTSPDRHWTLQNVDRDQEPHHSILLKDNTTGKTRKICDYNRSATVIWSPDSRHFALNDNAGSNYAEASIVAVDEAGPMIKLQDAILNKNNAAEGGHEYFGAVRWLDARRLVIHNWGHNDEPPLGEHCVCYVYMLAGSLQKCADQPNGSDIEGLCRKTTP